MTRRQHALTKGYWQRIGPSARIRISNLVMERQGYSRRDDAYRFVATHMSLRTLRALDQISQLSNLVGA